MINAKLQNLYNIKNDIGTAIVNKGGTINESTPFYSYAGQIDNISTGPSSYSGWVVQDVNGTKYTAITNQSTGTINGPNIVGTNLFSIPFLRNSTPYSEAIIQSLAINNGFVYVAGESGKFGDVKKYHASNLAYISNSSIPYIGGNIRAMALNNNFIYVGGTNFSGGTSSRTIYKYHENNLTFVNNTASYGGDIRAMALNNNFIYVGGGTNQRVQKFHESNLAFVGSTADYGALILSVTTNNGFIYVGGSPVSGINRGVSKYFESNLTLVGNTVNFGGTIYSLAVNNGFIYAIGATSDYKVQKYHEGNLQFVGSSGGNYGTVIFNLTTNNGFVYAGGAGNGSIWKMYESNLTFVNDTVNYGSAIWAITANNGFIYIGGGIASDPNSSIIKMYDELGTEYEQLPSYVFNRWELNNSTTSSVLINNAELVGPISVNGPNLISNISFMPFNAKVSFLGSGAVFNIIGLNNFIYVGGSSSSHNIVRHFENNLAISLTAPTGQDSAVRGMVINNGFIFTGGTNFVRRYHLSNLGFSTQSGFNYGGAILGLAANNGFVFAGGVVNTLVRKYSESTLSISANSANYGGQISTVHTYNGFVYAGGYGDTRLRKYHESNLVFVAQSESFSSGIHTITSNNGFIYIGDSSSLKKIHENNLVLSSSGALYGYTPGVSLDYNGFVYTTDGQRFVKKYYESNLALVGQSQNDYTAQTEAVAFFNNFAYVGGQYSSVEGATTVKKYAVSGNTPEVLNYYTITSLKGE